ncbi:type I polyketide synthase, partial [Streptomyces camponoticapitis]|uniref:type I polyketide synthase n=1 Tax=Streptomyces camponoticapitis TaxID=1616125 RepID=UPI001E2925BC
MKRTTTTRPMRRAPGGKKKMLADATNAQEPAEPIAIVGVGLRYPGGVRDLDAFGALLGSGTSIVTEVPPDRWGPEFWDPEGNRPGTIASHVGMFLDDIDKFDPAHFGIAAREVGSLDPQQRLIMEIAWEAMCDSGRPVESWYGTRTGVFTGILAHDYALLHSKTLGTAGIGPHYAPGTEFSFAAGRLAHAFDLRGPAAAVDTACSSSLYAVSMACQNLRSGECDTALAGGVNVMTAPELSVFMSRVGAISPTGQIRPFHAAADGVVRGEGCGFVVLKRLSDAVADRDQIYATIRGWAVNQDGRSLGVTAPNAMAQIDLHHQALRHAGLGPDDVDFVEAHGTGTPLGDQTELMALADAYKTRSADRPVYIGSSKAVYGHTDAAAGITGLLKAVWIARAAHVPAQPGLDELSRAVDWKKSGIAIPTSGESLNGLDRPVRAGVSSFGLSGTNVHVFVETAAFDDPPRPPAPDQPLVLLASASGERELAEQVTLLRDRATEEQQHLGDVIASAATRRTHETHRYAAVAAEPAALLAALDDPQDPPDGAYTGIVDPRGVPAPVFVFSGQGSQWPGMAADLVDGDATVRATLEECDALVRTHTSWSLIDELRRVDGSNLNRTDIAQPAIFAVQLAATRWLAERGVRPAAVVGHSIGEIAAAHAAGALPLADAVRLVVQRGEILHETAGTGGMLAVKAAPASVTEVLGDLDGSVVVAAVNGPDAVVVAGPHDGLEAAEAAFTARGLRAKRLDIDYAFHSPLVAASGGRLHGALTGIEPAEPSLRMLSSVDPDADVTRLDADYWARNVTEPVQLWPAVERLLREDHCALVEIGAHPVLARALAAGMAQAERPGPVIPTLRRDERGALALHRTLARLHVAGISVDWEKTTGTPQRYRRLPVPSWGGDRYWLPGVDRGEQGGTQPAVPAQARLSLLSSDGRVIAEMLAEPTGGPAPAAAQAPALQAPAAAPAAPAAAAPAPPPAAAGPSIAPVADRVEKVTRAVLGNGSDKPLPRRRGLFEQGMDSLTAVELRTRLEAEFGLALSSTVVFEHPTIEALGKHLAGLLPADGPGQTPAADAAARSGADAGRGTAEDGVAVVGIACRLPGAGSPDEYWTLLSEGRNSVGEPPADRRKDAIWAEADPDVPTRGGYLADVAGFDADFFRVSPREARSLDPQQRLMLEVAWEALEDSGHPAGALEGRPVGVYLGLNTADYQQLLTRDMRQVDHYYGTGTSFAATAGRLSYFLGLRGPSIAVDTACSASLTALHLACQGLENGDCEVAVIGGANVIVAPTVSVSMTAAGGLAPDGRCKTFDDAADGYGRGEGAVALILKPLAAAKRDGDRVYAVVRGSAVNQDGASGGMTVPNAAAQTAVVRQALERAGWAPGDVDYVEAHGTGTPLGDPIEVHALAEALGRDRPESAPVLIGSAKANIGHLEAAAGAAGLLKTVLSLHRGEIPPHPLDRPSTRIEWDRLPVSIATTRQQWPDRGRPARAGVSAFGFSGSNAHVLVEQAPQPARAEVSPRRTPPYVLPVTAATSAALRRTAARMAARLRAAPHELDDVVFTAAYRRTWLDHRLAAVGESADELAAALEESAEGRPSPLVRTGEAASDQQRTVALWYGPELPGAELRRRLATVPGYARALETCAEAIGNATGSTPDLMAEPPGDLYDTYLFCHQVAATMLWSTVGVTPYAAAGQGGGQIAAAWTAGQLTIADGVRLLTAGPEGIRLLPPRLPVLAADHATPADSAEELAARVASRPEHAATPDEAYAGRLADAGVDAVVDVALGELPQALDELFRVPVDADDALRRLALTAADLFVTGGLPAAGATQPRPPVSLPSYPWEHRPYWYRNADDDTAGRLLPFVVSAGSPSALRDRAERLHGWVADRPQVSTADLGWSLATTVNAQEHRGVVLARDRHTFLDGLQALSRGIPGGAVLSGNAMGGNPVVVFPGQGSQWAGMAVELFEESPVFAEQLRACADALAPHVDWDLLAVLRGEKGAPGL